MWWKLHFLGCHYLNLFCTNQLLCSGCPSFHKCWSDLLIPTDGATPNKVFCVHVISADYIDRSGAAILCRVHSDGCRYPVVHCYVPCRRYASHTLICNFIVCIIWRTTAWFAFCSLFCCPIVALAEWSLLYLKKEYSLSWFWKFGWNFIHQSSLYWEETGIMYNALFYRVFLLYFFLTCGYW